MASSCNILHLYSLHNLKYEINSTSSTGYRALGPEGRCLPALCLQLTPVVDANETVDTLRLKQPASFLIEAAALLIYQLLESINATMTVCQIITELHATLTSL